MTFEPDTTLQPYQLRDLDGTKELGKYQKRLTDLHFYNYKIDNDYGPRTQAAWNMFRDLMDDGILNQKKYKVYTNDCAAFSNALLRDAGYGTWGDAWNLHNTTMKYNGYKGVDKPGWFDRNKQTILAYNRAAANNLANNFNPDELDKEQDYAVNMYNANSGNWKKAWQGSRWSGTRGTHTGILRYNKKDGNWYVMHNIHGNLYTQKLQELMGDKGTLGITAILRADKPSFMEKAASALTGR